MEKTVLDIIKSTLNFEVFILSKEATEIEIQANSGPESPLTTKWSVTP